MTLEVCGLEVRSGASTLVQGDLCIERGSASALVGRSGAGKTTFAHAILGLLPPSLDVLGAIRFQGNEVCSLRHSLGKSVALVPQFPAQSLDPMRKVEAQLREHVRLHVKEAKTVEEQRDRVEVALEEAGLGSDVKRLYPHQLSGGMAQRVLLAMAFSTDTDLLVADEPSSALDLELEAELIETLHTKMSVGLSVLLITHHTYMAQAVCKRSFEIRDGLVQAV